MFNLWNRLQFEDATWHALIKKIPMFRNLLLGMLFKKTFHIRLPNNIGKRTSTIIRRGQALVKTLRDHQTLGFQIAIAES